MHKRKAGIAFVGIGVVLIVSALLLFLYNETSNAVQQTNTSDIYRELQMILEQEIHAPMENIPSAEGETIAMPEVEQETEVASMKAVMLHGYTYIGILEIPLLQLQLPILSDWDDEKLEIAPCRQFGSIKTDDLVIAGHNYRRHFLSLYKLSAGDTIWFTDMGGNTIEYSVAQKQTLQETDVDAVQNSGYDLVLYTCTYSGKERTAVFCNRTETTADPRNN